MSSAVQRLGTQLQELKNHLTSQKEIRRMAGKIPGPTIGLIAQKAKVCQMHIVAGSILEIDQGKLYNTSVFIDSRGQIIGRYRKTHPENATAKNEVNKGIIPGEDYPVFDTENGSSRIADPEGNIIAKASNFYEGMAVATIDTEFTKLWRNEIIPRDYPLRRKLETYEFMTQFMKGKSQE